MPEPTEKPATAEVIPGIGALAESFPGGPQALQKVLNDPQVLKFITSNPDIVQGFIKNGLPDPDKLQTLLALAGPTPEGMYLFNIPVLHSEIFIVPMYYSNHIFLGAETGIFGPNIFAGKISINVFQTTKLFSNYRYIFHVLTPLYVHSCFS